MESFPATPWKGSAHLRLPTRLQPPLGHERSRLQPGRSLLPVVRAVDLPLPTAQAGWPLSRAAALGQPTAPAGPVRPGAPQPGLRPDELTLGHAPGPEVVVVRWGVRAGQIQPRAVVAAAGSLVALDLEGWKTGRKKSASGYKFTNSKGISSFLLLFFLSKWLNELSPCEIDRFGILDILSVDWRARPGHERLRRGNTHQSGTVASPGHLSERTRAFCGTLLCVSCDNARRSSRNDRIQDHAYRNVETGRHRTESHQVALEWYVSRVVYADVIPCRRNLNMKVQFLAALNMLVRTLGTRRVLCMCVCVCLCVFVYVGR